MYLSGLDCVYHVLYGIKKVLKDCVGELMKILISESEEDSRFCMLDKFG